MAETKEQVDHRAEALKWLKRSVRSGRTAENRTADASVAQVHASLAIAQGQERVAGEIKAFRALMWRSAT
jgi:hypothetical protein